MVLHMRVHPFLLRCPVLFRHIAICSMPLPSGTGLIEAMRSAQRLMLIVDEMELYKKVMPTNVHRLVQGRYSILVYPFEASEHHRKSLVCQAVLPFVNCVAKTCEWPALSIPQQKHQTRRA